MRRFWRDSPGVVRGLPEFAVIDQVIGPKQLELHLQRRSASIGCPRCQTPCARVQESRPRCIRDLPILQCPVLRYRKDPQHHWEIPMPMLYPELFPKDTFAHPIFSAFGLGKIRGLIANQTATGISKYQL